MRSDWLNLYEELLTKYNDFTLNDVRFQMGPGQPALSQVIGAPAWYLETVGSRGVGGKFPVPYDLVQRGIKALLSGAAAANETVAALDSLSLAPGDYETAAKELLERVKAPPLLQADPPNSYWNDFGPGPLEIVPGIDIGSPSDWRSAGVNPGSGKPKFGTLISRCNMESSEPEDCSCLRDRFLPCHRLWKLDEAKVRNAFDNLSLDATRDILSDNLSTGEALNLNLALGFCVSGLVGMVLGVIAGQQFSWRVAAQKNVDNSPISRLRTSLI